MKIEIKDLTKRFDDIDIIKKVNLEFEEGKIYGFIGKNGSGKSVLFKLICGLYTPTNGSVVINGVNIHEKNSFYEDMRILIEKPNFISQLSGFENLKVLASIQNKIGVDEIESALKQVNLYEERNKKYSKYSLGMKQKLGLAQVFMENPKVMILDEPLNGIEEKTANKIREILKEEKKKGKIILIASHIKEDIIGLADEIYKIEEGVISKYIVKE